MKKLLFTLLIAAAGVISVKAQDGVYRDDQGDYHYETRSEQVWVPEQRVGGIFGVGGRTIPGHYETRTEQVKVYNDRYQNGSSYGGQKGWKGKHPHGMPPGQRKKLNNYSGYPGYEQGNGGYSKHGKGAKKSHHND